MPCLRMSPGPGRGLCAPQAPGSRGAQLCPEQPPSPPKTHAHTHTHTHAGILPGGAPSFQEKVELSPLGGRRGWAWRGVGGTLLVGASLAGSCRGRGAKKCLLSGSICWSPDQQDKLSWNQCQKHPRTWSWAEPRSCRAPPPAAGSWAGERRAGCGPRLRAGGLAGRQEAARVPGCRAEGGWRQEHPPCAPKREGRLGGVSPLALSCSAIHHREGKSPPRHELFNSVSPTARKDTLPGKSYN